MPPDFYLAWRYLRHHKARTLILIACLSLLAFLPLGLHSLLLAGERLMSARAANTPLLIGARGSSLDITLNALYFSPAAAPPITMGEAERVAASGWAESLPIHARLRAQGHALVGVTLDYFEFRRLRVAQGQMLAMLGECLLGADAARELRLQPGDTLNTAPENLFDLAGAYPLKLHIAGVLEKSHSPDDQAIFIDVQTAWVIEGLGHGHAAAEPGKADPKLLAYAEITPENLDSFHFHGDPATYPISALIVLPHDRRASALLRGRYLDAAGQAQIFQPLQAVQSLLHNIFRVSALFDAVLLAVGAAALLLLGLVFALSLRLRRREMQTIFLLGCSRWTAARLLAAEIALLACASGVACLALLIPLQTQAEEIARRFLLP
jgi:putative ABC transport system permease protein